MRVKKINMHKFMGVFNMKKGIIKNVIITGLISNMDAEIVRRKKKILVC